MALNKSSLKSGLDACFTSMNNMSSGGDAYFAQQLATLIGTYLASASISSTGDSGSVGSNPYAGASSGTGIPIAVPSLTSGLSAHFQSINGDDDSLASYIQQDVANALASAVITVTTSGLQTLPNGSTSPAAGPGTGKFSNPATTIESQLKALFAQMKTYDSNGNPLKGNGDLSQTLADAIDTYVKGGSIALTFTGTVVGSGTGKAS